MKNMQEMKKVAFEYLKGKQANNVAYLAIATRDGFISIVSINDMIEAIERNAENFLEYHSGVRIKRLTRYPSRVSNIPAMVLFKKEIKCIDMNRYTDWKTCEVMTAKGIGGKRTGGLNNHKADVYGNIRGAWTGIEVKGREGLLDKNKIIFMTDEDNMEE